MKRKKLSDNAIFYRNAKQHQQCLAYHEAGHAAAVYLNNKARGMPPVFLNLYINGSYAGSEDRVMDHQTAYGDYIGRVEGGRLIQSLPDSFAWLDQQLTENNMPHLESTRDFWVAFELDIINLLAGPLAEAKFVAVNDGELFSHRLVNLQALENYGGSFDLALIDEYLDGYSDFQQQQDEKLNELFIMAFHFVNDYENWKAITKLADYILESNKRMISYEEAVAALENNNVRI